MNKIALVTGASRGIGRAIFATLLKAGYTTYGTATSEKGVALINEAIAANNGHGGGLVFDITEPDGISALMERLPHPPSILVNNAGITRDNLLMRMSESDWDDVISANLTGIFRLSKAAVRPMMKARWGRIVNIGSVVARMGNPGQSNYAAAKAGLEGFSRALALEIGSRGVTVNVVSPGYIETDMTDELSDDVKQKAIANVALGRFGEPEDVANVVRFLVSDEASYITAATIPVNGGLFAG